MAIDYKKQKKRIKQIFQSETDDLSVRTETLGIYWDFLLDNLSFPIELTGIEDFSWEEFYVFGPGDKTEYEELKKTRPSYTDIFIMKRLDDHYNEDNGLFAKVKRKSDSRKFQIPLAELEAIEKKSDNYQFLDDYAGWFWNYR